MRILKAARGRITGHFGDTGVPGAHVPAHRGTDIGHGNMTADDLRVIAPAAGRVTAAGWYGTYGNRIEIDHGDGWSSLLAHLARIDVAVGDDLTAGQDAGEMGDTGGSWAVHLHQELRYHGIPVDAEPYFTTLAGLDERPIAPPDEEQSMSQIQYYERQEKGYGKEWMIAGLDLDGGVQTTTDEATAVLWSRQYRDGRGPITLDRDTYVSTQRYWARAAATHQARIIAKLKAALAGKA